ncbi:MULTISPECIES: hypothetical protein [Providencia]|uniref:hypothetical protein n=1 Tax=Providencia TaxID=586 RepID=UPI0015EBA931|nr:MULTISPECIES: hypothetical protein [Providencia]ELR5139428.1 hypothetical protein [Providencia rettgeri]QLQ92414.1 hypothetical protein H0907_14030 [Providencia rettgeri]WEB83025.1 hypothetical protein LVJ10_14055 [Providencia rettgeri]HCH7935601.1 hypothetical protein [Providencia rettgeri]
MKIYANRISINRRSSEEKKENNERIKILNLIYKKTKNKRYKKLARKIQDCEEEYNCNSLACAQCIKVKQLDIVNQFGNYINKKYVFVTLIFYKDKITINELPDFNPNLLKDKLRKKLKSIGFNNFIFGSLELDLHLYESINFSYYQPHFHLLIPNESEKIKSLRDYMKSSKNLSSRQGIKNRPMVVDEINDIGGVIKYITKIMWCEMAFFTNKEGKLKHSSKRRISNSRMFADSLVKLDTLKFSDIFFKCNFQ